VRQEICGVIQMKANVFLGKNQIRVQDVPKPRAGVGEEVIRVTLTTICGTDLHIVRGECQRSFVTGQWIYVRY
jgi:threonine dehydrogenase-like Zn-dependent dehydrogenase